jgi:hypothetical protein
MLDLFKHIREVFNKPSVKNEDWLDPSDRVLFNIEAEINKGNNKDRSILFFILPFLFFLIGVSFVLFFNFQNQIQRVENESQNTISDEIFARTNGEQNFESEIKSKVIEGTSIHAPLNSSEKNKVDLEVKQENTHQYTTLTINSNNNQNEGVNNLYTSFVEKNIASSIVENTILLPKQSSIKSSSKSEYSTHNYSSVYPNKHVENVVILNLGNVGPTSIESSFPNLCKNKVLESELSKISNQFFIEATTGIALWDFNLNDNFRNLVEPAAFVNSNAIGFNTSLRIGKQINSKFGLSVNLDYSNVRLSSGHNSALIFDNNVDQQTHSVTMATPLGFVNSEVALFRTSGSSTGETNLLVDLESEHQIEALEISLAADIEIVDKDQINLTLSPGVGLQQILNSKNELASFTTNNVNIESDTQVVESEFNDLNTLSPIAKLGLSLRKELNGNWEVGLGLDGSVNLNPIQQNGDLNTRVMRYTGNLVLRKKF